MATLDWSTVTLVMVPGLGNSGPEHWQSRWERAYPCTLRVVQKDWDNPVRPVWVAALEQTLAGVAGQVILVGHSAGAMTIVHWAAGNSRPVLGALLVAPPDFEAEIPCLPSRELAGAGWLPIPRVTLPFLAVVVASTNDSFATPSRSAGMAGAWGARCVSIGDAGHINAEAGFGPWPEGEKILEELATAGIRRS